MAPSAVPIPSRRFARPGPRSGARAALLAGLCFGLAPNGATGAEPSRAEPSRAGPECRCRHAGVAYRAGEYACINTSEGPRLALCSRVSNLSSWKFTDRRCDRVSGLAEPPVPGRTASALSGRGW